jgi:carboxyl-terminal processing protease
MLLVGLTLFCASARGVSNNTTDAEHRTAILREAIHVVSENAYNSSKVDWSRVAADALGILAGDNSDAGLDASILFVIAKLKDGHSRYVSGRSPALTTRAPPSVRAPLPIGSVTLASGSVPIVKVNAWSGGDMGQVRAAAKSLRGTLNEALSQETCGIIVDLSSNSGGNMWPMLAGLLPLLSEGTLGAFESADGVRSTIVSTGDSLILGGQPHYLNWPTLADPRFLPGFIALIVGPQTASSGEITALMFRGQANVRVFGRRTAGHASANRAFKLANGSTLVLTTAATIDRTGKKYWDPIDPDVESEGPIESAHDWLRNQCG